MNLSRKSITFFDVLLRPATLIKLSYHKCELVILELDSKQKSSLTLSNVMQDADPRFCDFQERCHSSAAMQAG